MGCGPAQPVKFAVLHGPARHEKRPIGPCLGRRPGTKPTAARLVRPVNPCRPDAIRAVPSQRRAVPGRAGPLAIYSREILEPFLARRPTTTRIFGICMQHTQSVSVTLPTRRSRHDPHQSQGHITQRATELSGMAAHAPNQA